MDSLSLPQNAFTKWDHDDDARFYAPPRLVTHIDDTAIAALTDFYQQVLPAGGVILDLMSSWVSHLPGEVAYAEVIGHGMNAEELAANPRLGRWFVQNLNANPILPLESASVDAVTVTVSVQYLQRPVEVFAEAGRVLRPGGITVVSFSNRCFPTKAVAIWQALDADGHARLVEAYLQAAGFTDVNARRLADGRRGDPLTAVMGRAPEPRPAAAVDPVN